jgi:hypothetical protein
MDMRRTRRQGGRTTRAPRTRERRRGTSSRVAIEAWCLVDWHCERQDRYGSVGTDGMPSPPTETERLWPVPGAQNSPQTPPEPSRNERTAPKGGPPAQQCVDSPRQPRPPNISRDLGRETPQPQAGCRSALDGKMGRPPLRAAFLPSGLTTERLIVVAERRAVRVVAGVLARLRAALEVAGLTSPRAVAESGGWRRNGNREGGHDARNALTPTHRTLLPITRPLLRPCVCS